MPRRPLLAIVVSHDAAANELHMEVMGSPELRINPQLDAEVSLRAQQALASVSPSFDAELTATTHFVENLERITRDEATARISDVATTDTCQVCGHGIIRDPAWRHVSPGRGRLHDPTPSR